MLKSFYTGDEPKKNLAQQANDFALITSTESLMAFNHLV